MTSLSLSAPAKLNLFLHVTGRLPNGYHTLQSIFVLIDLCDTIELTLKEGTEIHRTGDIIGDPKKDLCVRAAQLLQQTFSVPLGIEINVTKRIPAGAGMGGGSSDAATTLLGLNHLWGLNLPREKLMQLGQRLGADVVPPHGGRDGQVFEVVEPLVPPAEENSSQPVAQPDALGHKGRVVECPYIVVERTFFAWRERLLVDGPGLLPAFVRRRAERNESQVGVHV